MERITTKVKKWGNSFGIILPRKIFNKEVREGLEVNVIIQPKNRMTVGDLLNFSKKNKLPKLKKSTQQIMDEIDKELWPEDE
ncbi:MAG: hypothetical protein KKF48_04985 [Nanoarchaeota archaeon]|nr:hypothetical protein [Nanoarchaeota archaeon]MBU1028372.1 hypothetical protein [Nanoarchaeota archaeon]